MSNFQTFRQLPSKSRNYADIEFEGLRHQSIIVVNGEKAWRRVDGNTTEMTEEETKGYLDSERVGPLVALVLKNPAHTFSLLGERKMGARAAIGLKMTHTEFREYQLWFDKETGLLAMIKSRRKDEQGNDIVSESLFQEYKEVDGIPVACSRTNTSDGNTVSETNYGDLKFVENLEAELFDRRNGPSQTRERLPRNSRWVRHW